MWIVRHKNDRGGELRYLFPETNYMIGRDDSADFLFHSQKSSRELVELVTGPCTAERTPLYLRIVSRAKSIINGKTYKLKGKDAPVVEMDFTKEPRIIVECSASAGAESQMINPDTPVVIEWVEFSLFVRAVDEFVERAQAHKVGFRLVDKVGDATHYYSDGKDEESDEFKEAVFRGIPVLGSSWLELMLGHEEGVTVDDWLLNVDYRRFLPGGNEEYLPVDRSSLFEGVKLVSLERIKWVDTVVVDASNLEQEIRSKIGDQEFTLISDARIDNLQCITKAQLWGFIKKNDTTTLPKNTIKQLKRPAPEPALEDTHPPTIDLSPPDKPKARKRRKYEKVDKLHFFSLANPEPSPAPARSPSPTANTVPVNEKQVEATPEVPATNESDDTSNTKEFTPSDDGGQPMLDSEDVVKAQREASIASAEPQSSEDTAPTVRVDSSQNDTQPGESDSLVGRKRKLESSTDKKPTKIGKFVPKVSLVEAVLQVKESNKPEVVELDDNIEDLKNLTIVEVVDLVPRKNKDKNDENEGFYTGRKNFKKFRKPQKKTNRRRVGLVTFEEKMNHEYDEEAEFPEVSEMGPVRRENSEGPDKRESQRRRVGLFLNDNDSDEEN